MQLYLNPLNAPVSSHQATAINAVKSEAIAAALDVRKKNPTLVADALLKIRSGTAIVCCQGDSLTYGVDVYSAGTVPPVPPHVVNRVVTPYPEKMTEELNRIYSATGISVVNQGFSGDTALSSYNRWPVNPSADIAFLMLGTNDAKVTGISVSDYTKYMALLIERFNDWGTGVVVITSPSIGQGQGATPIESYRLAASKVALAYGCPVFKSDVIGLNNAYSDVYSDAVHFNQAGYSLFGSSVAWFIASGGLAGNPNIISSEKTLLFGYESSVATNGAFGNNSGSYVSQGFICTLTLGTTQRATLSFYLDADAAYISLAGRLAVGCAVSFDSNNIRSVSTREGVVATTTANYTVQSSATVAEPGNDVLIGRVIGRGWHSVTIGAPSSASATNAFLSALNISPKSQDRCSAAVFNVDKKSFSFYDPAPQYSALIPASSAATFNFPAALFASLLPLTSFVYISAFVEITICQTVGANASYSKYCVRASGSGALSAVLIASAGSNPVLISSITATSVLSSTASTVTVNLTRAVAGYMEMRFDIPDVPQLLNAALF